MASPPNIYIVGSQCTGKTTLVNAICRHFFDHGTGRAPEDHRPGVIKEVARSVLEKHKFVRSDIRDSQSRALELQKLIIEAQYESERAHLNKYKQSWFISDRSAVDPVIYARKYASAAAADALCTSEKWLEMKSRMSRSVIVVCEASVEWLVDDGVRLMPLDPDEWLQLHGEFCAALADMGLEYHVLPGNVGDMDERVEFVLSRWKEKKAQLLLQVAGDADYMRNEHGR